MAALEKGTGMLAFLTDPARSGSGRWSEAARLVPGFVFDVDSMHRATAEKAA
jgi:hypothetical protein